tara:strand:- start:983 stop:1171 length:189 start_codon:yes stop_codon:yes gene_type:complete
MWVSEIRNAPDVNVRLLHRETFETLEEGSKWALDWWERLTTDDGTHNLWLSEELVIEHRELR